jgi:hypothetical protein
MEMMIEDMLQKFWLLFCDEICLLVCSRILELKKDFVIIFLVTIMQVQNVELLVSEREWIKIDLNLDLKG